MTDISKFLNLSESVKSGSRYNAVPVSDAELTELIAEAHMEIGFAIGAQDQVEGAVNRAIIEGIATGAEFESFIIQEAFAPTGFLKKVIDFFVGLWRKLVAFIKGIVGNLFASGSKMREKVSYIKEVGGRVKTRKYANTTTVKYKDFVLNNLETAMSIAAHLLNAENYYTQQLEEGTGGSNVTFNHVNDRLEGLGQAFIETYTRTEKETSTAANSTVDRQTTTHTYNGNKGAVVGSEASAKTEATTRNNAYQGDLDAFKAVERKLGDGEKGSIELLRLVLKTKIGKDNGNYKKFIDEVKENDSVKKFTNGIKEKLFPVDWKEQPATGTDAIQKLAEAMEKTATTAASSGLDSLLTKEVEALDTKAKRMESVGKQLESGAKLSNASVDYRDGAVTKTLDNEKDAGKLITEIAQIAQKIGSAFSAAINAGFSVATGLYMETINEAYACATALDKAPIIAN